MPDRAKQSSVNDSIPNVIIPADPVDLEHGFKQQIFVLIVRQFFHISDLFSFIKAVT